MGKDNCNPDEKKIAKEFLDRLTKSSGGYLMSIETPGGGQPELFYVTEQDLKERCRLPDYFQPEKQIKGIDVCYINKDDSAQFSDDRCYSLELANLLARDFTRIEGAGLMQVIHLQRKADGSAIVGNSKVVFSLKKADGTSSIPVINTKGGKPLRG